MKKIRKKHEQDWGNVTTDHGKRSLRSSRTKIKSFFSHYFMANGSKLPKCHKFHKNNTKALDFAFFCGNKVGESSLYVKTAINKPLNT